MMLLSIHIVCVVYTCRIRLHDRHLYGWIGSFCDRRIRVVFLGHRRSWAWTQVCTSMEMFMDYMRNAFWYIPTSI